MFDFFKRIFRFIKKNPSVLYSLFLVVFLPLALWWNTAYTVQSFEKKVDLVMQNKALAIEKVLATFLVDVKSDPEALQHKVSEISEETSELKRLRLIDFEDGNFKIIASHKPEEVGKTINSPSVSISWHQDQNIAHLVGEEQERFWKVIRPVRNKDDEKIALISLLLSLKKTDALISGVVETSYLVVLITAIIAIALVLHHTRLFQYLRLYKELRKADKMKDEFIRMAIHELQSPIVNIRNYVEDLKEQLPSPLDEAQKRDISRISLSAESLSKLVYDILKATKIEQGALDTSPQRINPGEVVEEIVDSMKMRAESQNLGFSHKKEKATVRINVNPNRFREILTNLIDNALKYTKRGEIQVEEKVDQSKGGYYISVKDTGIGISGEEQKKLFNKFSRIKNRETAGITGTGLGLWIVKNLVQQMGGTITLESMKGTGSRFTVSFPLAS